MARKPEAGRREDNEQRSRGMRRGKRGKRGGKMGSGMELLQPHAAGIDVGAREHFVAVPPDACDSPVRSFGVLTPDLHALADWLLECEVRTVAMESTGIYWVPLYEILSERGLAVCLVNAHDVHNVPGRKSDVLDCQWLQKLHSFGLLRPSFRPSAEFVRLRSILRHREGLVSQSGAHVQRMQKCLVQMNLQLHNVISDLTGKTGMAILRAIVDGERDPKVLSQHRDPRCRSSHERIAASLTGNYQPEHVFSLRHELEFYDFCQQHIRECDEELERQLTELRDTLNPTPSPVPPPRIKRRPQAREPQLDLRTLLHGVVGVDLTAIEGIGPYTAACLIAEIGADMSAWKSDKNFSSWLRLVPRADITGGKARSVRTKPTTNRANRLLRLAAVNAGKTDSAVGAFNRSIARRSSKPVAVTATAHKLARIIYAMLKNKVPYEATSAAWYDQEHKARQLRSLEQRARRLGMRLVASEEADDAA